MNIETIKTFQTLKTPFYYYDTTLLQATLQAPPKQLTNMDSICITR